LPRHHLEDRAGGADAHALAAPRAPGLVGIPVGADDDFGVLTAVADIEHAHDLNVLAGAHAARAQDAGGHVVADHRVAGPLVSRAQRQIAALEGRRDDAVLHEIPLELVARVGPTAVAEMIGRVTLGKEAQHPLRFSTAAWDCVVTTIPSATLVAHAGMSFAWPSTETRQIRQLPTVESFGYQHKVGISMPAPRAASRMVCPSSALSVRPSIFSAGILDS